jgi:hypothetical protein
MAVPTGPGIGVNVVMDRLDRVTVRREEFTRGKKEHERSQ